MSYRRDNNMLPSSMEEIPDLEKFYVRPEAAAQWRKGKKLNELVDTLMEDKMAYGVHINICQRIEPLMDKHYLCHACIAQTDIGVEHILDIEYVFKTMRPSHQLLIDLLISDFAQLVVGERNAGHDSVH